MALRTLLTVNGQLRAQVVGKTLARGTVPWLTGQVRRFKSIDPRGVTVDVGLVAAISYLPFAVEPIAMFHLIFLLLTVVALIQPLRHFLARVIPVMAATAGLLVLHWRNGDLPGAELGELPILSAIILIVFVAAERHRRAESRLQEQYRAVSELREQREQQLTADLVHSRQREMTRDVAAMVAHDINGLLSGIRLEMEACQTSGDASHNLRASAELVVKTVDDAAATLRDLVSMTQDHPSSAKTDLNTSVRRVVNLIRRTASPNIEVAVELHRSPLIVPLTTVRVVHVVMNLVRNGVDAMPDGGELLVRSDWRTGVDGPTAILTITDTGHGLPAHLAEEVFGAFYTTKEHAGGSGLGLYSVRQMLAESRGSIEMKTRLGGPTTLAVELPLLFNPIEDVDLVAPDSHTVEV